MKWKVDTGRTVVLISYTQICCLAKLRWCVTADIHLTVGWCVTPDIHLTVRWCYCWYSFDSRMVCKGHMNQEEWCNPVWFTCRNLYRFTSPSRFPVRDKNKLGKWNHCINSPSPCLTSQHMQNKNYHNSVLSQNPSLRSTNTITMHMMGEEKCFISFSLLFNMGTERAKKQQMVHATMLCSHKMLLWTHDDR